MVAITAWVAPGQGCTYCHNGADLSADDNYTKVVARRCCRWSGTSTRDWKTHVAGPGVTCYTCHRGNGGARLHLVHEPRSDACARHGGQPVPARTRRPARSASAALPDDPFTPFLAADPHEIRVDRRRLRCRRAAGVSIKQTEWTYGLMMHISQSLGVNCTFCHNTRSFASWDQSTPQRATAWYGIRMVRDLNDNYLTR